MSRQHAIPILIATDGTAGIPLTPVALTAGADQVSEATIQELVHAHPECLPIAEIDPLFEGAVSICRELRAGDGYIDNLLVTASGLPVLVECKLWRNPGARREVVGQLLEYANVLSRWTASDLQREGSRRLGREGNVLLELVRGAGHVVDEIGFNDALTLNLRRGRFLLLIVGDGVREGVEAIAEYLQAHAGLHFTIGLVEMPVFAMPGGARLVTPRVLARTHVVTRTVIAVPDKMAVVGEGEAVAPLNDVLDDMTADRIRFWTEFVDGLRFDDPDQPRPKVSKQGYVYLTLPVPSGSAWITVFRNVGDGKVGLFLSYTRDTAGERIARYVVEDWPAIRDELGGTVIRYEDKLGRMLISDHLIAGSLADSELRARALVWLRVRANDFINCLRPRIKFAATEIGEA